MNAPRRLSPLVPLIAAVVLLGFVLGLMMKERSLQLEEVVPIFVEGPEVVVRHREALRAAVDAIARNDPSDAIVTLEAFSFGERAVEPYRLYLLANSYSLAGDVARARRTLEQSWRLNPEMVVSADVGFHLLDLHRDDNRWSRVASLSEEMLNASGDEMLKASARRQHLLASFYRGDVGGVFRSALDLSISFPESSPADGALDLVAELRGAPGGEALSPSERLSRAEILLERRMYPQAVHLAGRIDPGSFDEDDTMRLTLVTGSALGRLGRHKESEEVLAPLFSGPYRFAIPALEASARNRRLMASASPNEADRTKHQAVYHERLRDLLSLPIKPELRSVILERLIDGAEKNEEIDRMKRLITALVRVEPSNDRGLQLMWDQGWLAWEKKNDPIAIDRFDFIAETYQNPAIRRQARYWLARTLERVGRAERAREIFEQLASSLYEDLYTQFASERLERPPGEKGAISFPLSAPEDWATIAEREMPSELRLAWELTLLGEYSKAREEIRRHRSRSNQRYADALFGESFHADGAWQIANRFLRRAYPSIGTAEQNDVPLHFLRMYYVLPFEDEIIENSIEREVDPAFVAALVHQETTFNPKAVSPVGAKGLMQLMPGTAKEIGQRLYPVYQEERLFDPDFNIDLGTYYISQVLEMMEGDAELAAAGYNGGPYRVRRWRRESSKPRDEFFEGMPLSETRNYVKRVVILRSSYRSLYPSLRTDG
ncbi:MAG: lytic transglycosylase domain-containing protein [Acidobacteria bacterium]|nr:lytic transglycosylase domain-containing protein [Acidobacteriota bacterium]